jgi:shikimate dehydrogenase
VAAIAITGGTRLLALVADPVAQARSPAMANDVLDAWGRLGAFVLLPMRVPSGGLRDVVTAIRRIENFAGAIVSMPHKTAIVALLDELTAEATLVGAVNVVRRTDEGRLVGTVLDGEGFVAGLRAAGHEIAGARCLLAGAGGAASAIAFALARHGCAALTITNRTAAKATALAERVRAAFPHVAVDAGPHAAGAFDVAVNATSLGMRGGEALPIAPAVVERCRIVAECVVAPERTPLLELAEARGRATHTGVPMLAAQMELMLRFMGVA